MQPQESLVTESTTLEASLVTKGATLEASLVTEGAALEASLVTKGIAMDDNFVAKESTNDFVTSSELLDKCNNSMEKKDTVTSCSYSGEQRMQQLQMECMHTYSSSNLPVESPPNPSTSNLKRRAACRWLEKEPPCSILTWEDLVSKFINELFPPSRTTNLRNEVLNFQQRFDESFHEAWDRYKDLLRACPHYGFTELHQLDTFYNALNMADQDSLNSTAGGNLLERRTQDVLKKQIDCFSSKIQLCQFFFLFRDSQTYSCSQSANKCELKDNIQGYVAAAAINYNQGLGSLPSNTIANPKGELKSITTRSGIVLDGHSIPIPPPYINPEEDELVEETLTDQDIVEYTIKLISNKEKLLELANTTLNENCSAVILKKLLEKLGDPGKFLIPCGFSKLKCKALVNLGASFNLMPLSVWKKLGLHELISTRMTLELADRVICTPAGIARDVFVPVGKFTFPADFVIVDYKSDPRPSDNPTFFSHPILTSPKVIDDVFNPEGGNVLSKKLLDHNSTEDLHPPHNVNPLSGSTTSYSPNHLLEEFADELALITFPPRNDDLSFDIESDLKKIEYLLHHDPIKDIDSILKDSIDQSNIADLNDNLANAIPKMFTEEHALDYSSPPLYDEYDDDLFEIKFDTEYVYDDLFDSKGEKIKESKLLIDELDMLSDFLPPSEYDSFLSEDFSKVDALPSTNNEDKVFNLCILIQENLFKVITRVAPEKNIKKLAISDASLILEAFYPHLYELPLFKEVPSAETPLSFSSKNKGKVFKPGILTSKGVHSSLILEQSHQGYKVFKINQILKSPMEIFLFSRKEDIHILDVPCLYFYPP
uniref:Reverse transcriptase domain-containing protein n=1 Tax=Tanacetum cinerariifolium TaxID=118510 RepID=A0A6L2K249_TANCI|nr:reverse transcriptase domain-containing protein [Tanacetum cinerariifolium]